MNRSSLFFIILFLNLLPGFCQEYLAHTIPSDLKKGANAVIRDYTYEYIVLGENKAKIKKHIVITILNEDGESFSAFKGYYDAESKYQNLNCRLYNSMGFMTKKFSKKDFDDYSATSGFSLFDDNRVKYFKPITRTYPYTVEYNSVEEVNTLFYSPTWRPVIGYNISVEQSSFILIFPPDIPISYYVKNVPDADPVFDRENNSYSWQLNNYKAVGHEKFSVGLGEFTPVIYTAPEKFNYGGYKGSMKSWSEIGNWVYSLNSGRQALPEEVKQEVLNLVKSCDSDEEKVRVLYKYLQENTRYVSIQLGIGGYQPIEAEKVANVGYGDCKALSNYMRSLLLVAGINSNYTLVRAGKNTQFNPDFPSIQFNHVILCVPLQKDTIWLECTSQNEAFGFIGNFTDDRYALLIDKEGGVLVKTKTYYARHNLQNRMATIAIVEDGSASIFCETHYSGLQYDNISRIAMGTYEEHKKHLLKTLDVPDIEVKKIQYTIEKEMYPSITETFNIQSNTFASVQGERIFLPLNPFNKISSSVKNKEERRSDIFIRYGYTDVDSIRFNIAGDYDVEYMPESIFLETQFGSYSATVTIEGSNIMYVRTISFKRGTYPKEEYDSFVDFLYAIQKNDKNKLVLRSPLKIKP